MQPTNSDASDLEKLRLAFHEISNSFGSVESLLESFGLSELPIAQRYGILFGVIVFTLTIATVFALLVFGGSFQRITEQAKTGKVSVESDYRVRLERPLLQERLISAQVRMMTSNYPNRYNRKEGYTNLTKMLSSLTPPKDDDGNNVENFRFGEQNAEKMIGYKQNYFMGYRKCQDKPGGEFLDKDVEINLGQFVIAVLNRSINAYLAALMKWLVKRECDQC